MTATGIPPAVPGGVRAGGAPGLSVSDRTASALEHLRAAARELGAAADDLGSVRGLVGSLRVAEGLALDARRLAENVAAEVRLKAGCLALVAAARARGDTP